MKWQCRYKQWPEAMCYIKRTQLSSDDFHLLVVNFSILSYDYVHCNNFILMMWRRWARAALKRARAY